MHYAMLLQDATPDTSSYMIAGYVIFTVLMAIYIVSFLARRRNLERDLSTLQAMQAENKAAKSDSPPRKRAATKRKTAPTKRGARSQVKKRPPNRK
jgi:hypothetical protein